MPIGTIARGSKETVRVTVSDRAGLVTDLTSSGPTFDVIDFNEVYKVTAGSASASGLVISALVDTTVGGLWAEGEYRLFVKYTVASEVIRKGPLYFMVSEH